MAMTTLSERNAVKQTEEHSAKRNAIYNQYSIL